MSGLRPAGTHDGARPLAFAFLLVLVLTQTPYVVATLRPPPDQAFIGTFWYGDDFYNYLSYAQQAEEGAFLFQNRLLLEPHPPALANPEWWLVGRLSRLFGGGHLILAYRLLSVIAAAGFLLVAFLWLRRLGLGAPHLLPALLLLATGGGLGGMLALWNREGLDVYAGLFPFLGLLTNPHFTVGTTLLLASLHLFDTAQATSSRALAIGVATVLALVRPYDLVLLVLVRTASVLVLEPPRRWFSALVPLGGLLPVVGYLYWLFYRNPAFTFYAETLYPFPPLPRFAWALGPATLLAVQGFVRAAADPRAERARVHLAAWAAVGLVIVLLHPVPYALQFLVGVGLPLLALGAFGLRARAPSRLWLVALLFSTSLVCTLYRMSKPDPRWFVARTDMEFVRALRPHCRAGDVLFAPPSVGIFVYGLTACRAFLAHHVDPGYEERYAELQGFAALTPERRAALLDAHRITHIALPGDAGPKPLLWLGPGTSFARRLVIPGRPGWSLYTREAAPAAP